MDATVATAAESTTVAKFRQILLWPVQLLPEQEAVAIEDRAVRLAAEAAGPWRLVDDEFGDPDGFQERHYSEFVTFLPTVQRFLYGQGRGRSAHGGYGESPVKVLRRTDVGALRVTLRRGDAPIVLRIAHVDLHLFFDIDVAMLAVEIMADDLPLRTVQDVIYRLGRIYPAFWHADGRAGNCPALVEVLTPSGEVLAASDYDEKRKYLDFVCRHRAPAIAAHWRFLLRPLVLDHADEPGALRYRHLEYYRMPLMAYLALSEPEALTAGDRACLALASAPGGAAAAPTAPGAMSFHELAGDAGGSGTWHAVSGHTVIAVGCADEPGYVDAERGHLGRFRHQHFLAFLLAHFHKAALLMFSDQLAHAVARLDVSQPAELQNFRRQSRAALENFLRFTHRYWFQEVTNQFHTRALFDLTRRQLHIDSLFQDVRQELQDMSQYLEAEAQRRQNTSMVRLTVVTIFGLTAAISTGFLGMNLFAWDDLPGAAKTGLFLLVLVPSVALTLYTVAKSARLSALLDAVSDESLSLRDKLRALRRVP